MGEKGSALIDFTEAAYDLGPEPQEWLSKLLQAGAPAIDHGLGVLALTCTRPPNGASLVIDQVHAVSPPDDLAERFMRLQREMPPSLLWLLSRPTMPMTLSEAAGDDLEAFRLIMRHFDFAKDGLGMSAFDPNGRGVYLIAPLPKVTTLSDKSRERWQMLAAHFGAGQRLRRALRDGAREPKTDLPHGAEAVINPKNFQVTDAQGPAKSRAAISALREAALQVDRARGRMRESDPEKALELWKALVRGRWSTVDWFDSDGRRFVLGLPNAPNVSDPRGLTEREVQVVAYVLFGQTNKLIGYNLGLSQGRVSTLLRSAMRKHGVQTRTQLVSKLRDFGSITED
ncbi:MAG: response regulator transcription factor [Deltaproteobacteria bacterium]|nr:response regulator transcription factor [Deltaproteobacteria bacterium]